MTEKMQADDVLSRQAVFVRCCLISLNSRRPADLGKLVCDDRQGDIIPAAFFERQIDQRIGELVGLM